MIIDRKRLKENIHFIIYFNDNYRLDTRDRRFISVYTRDTNEYLCNLYFENFYGDNLLTAYIDVCFDRFRHQAIVSKFLSCIDMLSETKSTVVFKQYNSNREIHRKTYDTYKALKKQRNNQAKGVK